jgi:hypothetical protein
LDKSGKPIAAAQKPAKPTPKPVAKEAARPAPGKKDGPSKGAPPNGTEVWEEQKDNSAPTGPAPAASEKKTETPAGPQSDKVVRKVRLVRG